MYVTNCGCSGLGGCTQSPAKTFYETVNTPKECETNCANGMESVCEIETLVETLADETTKAGLPERQIFKWIFPTLSPSTNHRWCEYVWSGSSTCVPLTRKVVKIRSHTKGYLLLWIPRFVTPAFSVYK